MPEQIASVEVDKQTLIKVLESLGVEATDLMAAPQGSFELEIKPLDLDKENVSVRVCNLQSS